MSSARRPVVGYLIAILATGVVALLRYALSGTVGTFVPLVPFVVPVVLAGWYGGLWAGLLATALGTATAWYFFIPPTDSFQLDSASGVAIAVFIAVGIAISWFSESLLAAGRRAEAQSQNLRRQAAELERTSQELVEREQQLDIALQIGRTGTWEWDAKSNRVTWSSTLEAIHGLAPGTFAGTFEAYQHDIHPEDRDRVAQAIQRHLGADEPYRVEYRIIWPDGGIHWLAARGKMLRDAAGRPVRMVGVCSDVSDRKHIEAELAEANRRKDEFLAMLSHELRNPLAVLWNALEIMRRAADRPETVSRARDLAERQMSHVIRLIDDLLDIGRITSGRLQLRREPVNIAQVIDDAVESCRPLCDPAGHELRVRLPGAPVLLEADRVRLAQVLANLLTNACKYTDAGGLIDLSAHRDGDWVVVRVRDNGAGIPPESLTKVFDLFVRLDRNGDRTGDQPGGLGIGLSLSKRLVELHGGTIEARSEGAGKGSEFLVRLPTAAYSRASSAG